VDRTYGSVKQHAELSLSFDPNDPRGEPYPCRSADLLEFQKSAPNLESCLGFCVALFLLCFSVLAQAQRLRHFNVLDSIAMSRLSHESESVNDRQVTFSPSGLYFALVTTRGLLESNQLESTIWIFNTSAVSNVVGGAFDSQQFSPIALVKMASPSNGTPIEDLRWVAKGQSIAFLGRNRNLERHLFVVGVKDRQLRQLSLVGQDVAEYDWVKDTIVYEARPTLRDEDLYQSGGSRLPDIHIGSGSPFIALLFPDWTKRVFGVFPPLQLWRIVAGKPKLVVNIETAKPVTVIVRPFVNTISLSPSGRYAVVTNYAEHVPRTWESYEPAYNNNEDKIVADSPGKTPSWSIYRPHEYSVVDLRLGKISSLLDAPLGASAGYWFDTVKAIWSRDEHELAVSNTFLPLDGPESENQARLAHPCVAAVDFATHRAVCVKATELPIREKKTEGRVLSDIEWGASDLELALSYAGFDGAGDTIEDNAPPELFHWEHGIWSRAKSLGSSKLINRGLSVTIRESVNEPPVVVATDVKTGNSRDIWNPNPQLATINLGEATTYHWRDKEGHDWSGGLVKPPDFVAGHRYPLVIQTHGFNPSVFLTDGYYSTADAARPLAAQGIMVLQVGEISTDARLTPREPTEQGVAGYEAAIERLTADGLVDPNRIGIIGFSRTGWYVLESLIQKPKLFAAATLADVGYMSFHEYLLAADYMGSSWSKEYEGDLGSKPFGEGLQKWLRDSPGFNTDKIHSPVLFEVNDPALLIYDWDLYAALRLQQKPVDLLYIRNGAHVLRKPRELLASQSMSVDWYDFWLNEHEDPDPAKADQYLRWRELRRLQEQQAQKEEKLTVDHVR
jgi:dienelactone hydrolase